MKKILFLLIFAASSFCADKKEYKYDKQNFYYHNADTLINFLKEKKDNKFEFLFTHHEGQKSISITLFIKDEKISIAFEYQQKEKQNTIKKIPLDTFSYFVTEIKDQQKFTEENFTFQSDEPFKKLYKTLLNYAFKTQDYNNPVTIDSLIPQNHKDQLINNVRYLCALPVLLSQENNCFVFNLTADGALKADQQEALDQVIESKKAVEQLFINNRNMLIKLSDLQLPSKINELKNKIVSKKLLTTGPENKNDYLEKNIKKIEEEIVELEKASNLDLKLDDKIYSFKQENLIYDYNIYTFQKYFTEIIPQNLNVSFDQNQKQKVFMESIEKWFDALKIKPEGFQKAKDECTKYCEKLDRLFDENNKRIKQITELQESFQNITNQIYGNNINRKLVFKKNIEREILSSTTESLFEKEKKYDLAYILDLQEDNIKLKQDNQQKDLSLESLRGSNIKLTFANSGLRSKYNDLNKQREEEIKKNLDEKKQYEALKKAMEEKNKNESNAPRSNQPKKDNINKKSIFKSKSFLFGLSGLALGFACGHLYFGRNIKTI